MLVQIGYYTSKKLSYTLYLLFSEPAMGKGGPSHTLISLKKDPMTDGIQTDFVGTRGSVMHRMHPTVLCKCHTITGQQTSRGRHRHLLTQHCPLVQQERC
ncbi:LOW QUALITY PROTEIN: hypothetical protein N5P37_003936 [Trichoderma harzianum]|nr:LOW QUALITY PROTEIN: hypothetical protein N5P37_003936 [Trichoderma harzianum]